MLKLSYTQNFFFLENGFRNFFFSIFSARPQIINGRLLNNGENLAVDTNWKGVQSTTVPDLQRNDNTKYNVSISQSTLPTCSSRQFTDNKTRIVIFTKYRSGSSFTFDILRNHPDTFAMFEPLMLLKSENYTFKDNVLTEFMTQNVLKCDFHTKILQHSFLDDLHDRKSFISGLQPSMKE